MRAGSTAVLEFGSAGGFKGCYGRRMSRTLTERFSVRLSPQDRRRLAALAKVEDRKESDMARRLIRQGLQQEPARG